MTILPFVITYGLSGVSAFNVKREGIFYVGSNNCYFSFPWSMYPSGRRQQLQRIVLQENEEFDPLDVMLDKARRRGVNPMVRIQVFADAPVLQKGLILTRGDVIFAVAALIIGLKGLLLGCL